MLFLDLYTLPNSTTGIDDILVETVEAVPELAPLLFAFIFFVVFLTGAGFQSRRLGTADWAMWSVISSLSVFFVALLMTVVQGLIHLDWLVIIVVITIGSAIWLLLDRKAQEI